MCQFVETNERNLCALVAINGIITVEMIECNLGSRRKNNPLRRRFQEVCPQLSINTFRIIPQAAFVRNLAAVTSKDNDTEFRVSDMS